jgi:hypothetical protein
LPISRDIGKPAGLIPFSIHLKKELDMKLISDAMRNGAKGLSQCFNNYFEGYPAVHGCCAMGAVAIGLGLTAHHEKQGSVTDFVGEHIGHTTNTSETLVGPLKSVLARFNHKNPDDALDLHVRGISEMIVQANDYAKLSIAEIADLVEAGEKEWMKEQSCVTS